MLVFQEDLSGHDKPLLDALKQQENLMLSEGGAVGPALFCLEFQETKFINEIKTCMVCINDACKEICKNSTLDDLVLKNLKDYLEKAERCFCKWSCYWSVKDARKEYSFQWLCDLWIAQNVREGNSKYSIEMAKQMAKRRKIVECELRYWKFSFFQRVHNLVLLQGAFTQKLKKEDLDDVCKSMETMRNYVDFLYSMLQEGQLCSDMSTLHANEEKSSEDIVGASSKDVVVGASSKDVVEGQLRSNMSTFHVDGEKSSDSRFQASLQQIDDNMMIIRHFCSNVLNHYEKYNVEEEMKKISSLLEQLRGSHNILLQELCKQRADSEGDTEEVIIGHRMIRRHLDKWSCDFFQNIDDLCGKKEVKCETGLMAHVMSIKSKEEQIRDVHAQMYSMLQSQEHLHAGHSSEGAVVSTKEKSNGRASDQGRGRHSKKRKHWWAWR